METKHKKEIVENETIVIVTTTAGPVTTHNQCHSFCRKEKKKQSSDDLQKKKIFHSCHSLTLTLSELLLFLQCVFHLLYCDYCYCYYCD